MNNYQTRWEERKGLLKSSFIMAVVPVVIFFLVVGASVDFRVESNDEILELIKMFLMSIAVLAPSIAYVRVLLEKESIAFGFLGKVWSSVCMLLAGAISLNPFVLVFGAFMLIIYGFLFAVVLVYNVVYFPISTLYLWIRAKLEKQKEIELVNSMEYPLNENDSTQNNSENTGKEITYCSVEAEGV